VKIRDLFTGTRYIGKADGDRKSYHVFQGDAGYLVVTPNSEHSFAISLVDAEVPEVLTKTFKGKQLTTVRLKENGRRPDLFGSPFAALNALYVMVALGHARKLKRREGRAMLFKIR
jgi:hypothetical protein